MRVDGALTRRMVALAVEPYLNSDRKLKSLYRRAVLQEGQEAVEMTALELLRMRHAMRTMHTVLEAMNPPNAGHDKG